jgi:2-C-methyl-D-erythritol 2,4-cyclodiphosphate synthase
MKMRIGVGYDIHRLEEDRKLFIGGVNIPYVKGLLGHSEGDVLLHSICDAMLGATNQADIGEHFPDTDPRYHNIPSIELLKSVNQLIKKKGFLVDNIDTVIIAQEPILSPFKKQIQKNIAVALEVDEDSINIKAKTNEGLGEIGRKEAIACWSVVLLTQKERK